MVVTAERGPCPHVLHGGETVSSLLRAALAQPPATRPVTVLLLRRGPDGLVRERIDLDSTLALVNPRQDTPLRDGDMLVVPDSSPRPVGLERPPVERISSPN